MLEWSRRPNIETLVDLQATKEEEEAEEGEAAPEPEPEKDLDQDGEAEEAEEPGIHTIAPHLTLRHYHRPLGVAVTSTPNPKRSNLFFITPSAVGRCGKKNIKYIHISTFLWYTVMRGLLYFNFTFFRCTNTSPPEKAMFQLISNT